MDLTPGPAEDQEISTEPLCVGETLTAQRVEVLLLAAARQVLRAECRLAGGFNLLVSQWFTRLSGECGVAGTEISDEMLGAIALGDIILRSRGEDPVYRAGREDAAKAVENADTSGWPGGRGSDVDGCQERAAQVARGRHPRTPGEDVTP